MPPDVRDPAARKRPMDGRSFRGDLLEPLFGSSHCPLAQLCASKLRHLFLPELAGSLLCRKMMG